MKVELEIHQIIKDKNNNINKKVEKITTFMSWKKQDLKDIIVKYSKNPSECIREIFIKFWSV